MTDYIPLINILGLASLGGAIVYFQWRTGSNTGVAVASEVIETYKTQVQQLREEIAEEKEKNDRLIHDLKQRITDLGLSLEHMKGADEEKEKKIKEFTDIFQGKNPETEQYMQDMRLFTAGVAQYMKDSAVIFDGMKTFMTNLNNKSITNEERNKRLDAKRLPSVQ